MNKLCHGFVALIVSLQPSHADEWVFGLGGDDYFDEIADHAIAGLIEYHSDPFLKGSLADVSWLGALQVDTAGDVFLGFGVYALSALEFGNLFLETSIAAGAFRQGSNPVKPADSFLLRTSFGIGMALSDHSRLSLSIDHLLNLDLENYDPGSEAVMLRLTTQF